MVSLWKGEKEARNCTSHDAPSGGRPLTSEDSAHNAMKSEEQIGNGPVVKPDGRTRQHGIFASQFCDDFGLVIACVHEPGTLSQ